MIGVLLFSCDDSHQKEFDDSLKIPTLKPIGKDYYTPYQGIWDDHAFKNIFAFSNSTYSFSENVFPIFKVSKEKLINFYLGVQFNTTDELKYLTSAQINYDFGNYESELILDFDHIEQIDSTLTVKENNPFEDVNGKNETIDTVFFKNTYIFNIDKELHRIFSRETSYLNLYFNNDSVSVEIKEIYNRNNWPLKIAFLHYVENSESNEFSINTDSLRDTMFQAYDQQLTENEELEDDKKWEARWIWLSENFYYTYLILTLILIFRIIRYKMKSKKDETRGLIHLGQFFFLCMISVILIFFFSAVFNSTDEIILDSLAVISLVFGLLTYIGMIGYVFNFSTLILSKNKITFNDTEYDMKDIKSVKILLTQKKRFTENETKIEFLSGDIISFDKNDFFNYKKIITTIISSVSKDKIQLNKKDKKGDSLLEVVDDLLDNL